MDFRRQILANTLFRSVGSSLASAVGGPILAAQTITLGGYALPSLTAYRILFGICAGAAVAGAILALFIPNSTQAETEPAVVPEAVPAAA